MKKPAFFVIVLFFALFGLNAQTVYVGGSYRDDNNRERACYWINGIMYAIDGISVNAIASEGSFLSRKVYTAGVYREYQSNTDIVRVCRYWINGTPYELPGCRFVHNIKVVNGDVYVTGNYNDGTMEINKTCYWKNGVRQPSPNDGFLGHGKVAVFNNAVYVAGCYTIDENSISVPYACYWKNGVRQSLTNSRYFLPTDIDIVDGHIYIGAISIDPKMPNGSCYWVNGVQQTIPNTGETSDEAFIVSGSSIYMLGEKQYWVNGIRYDYKPQRFVGRKYTAFNGKIFIAGGYYLPGQTVATACYWIDESPHDFFLFQGAKGPINTMAISVTE